MSFIPNYNTQNSNIQNNNNDNSLKNEIEKLKKDINRLNNENSSLKNENERLKNENKNLKKELDNYKKNLNAYKLEIDKLNSVLTNKKNEIKKLNDEMKNLKLNNNINEKVYINEIISIQFKSIDQKVDISYACKKDDVFVRIEEKLYNEYPDFKDLNTYFTVNGRVVKRFRSMIENDIRNNDKILLNIYE